MKDHSVKSWLAAAVVATLAIGIMAGPALAHHSFAMYDLSINKTLTGRLTRFIFGANHAQLIFELVGPDGKPQLDAEGKPITWGVETASARSLANDGITAQTFKAGTILTVTLNPLRDGRNFGALRNVGGELIGCGMAMPAGGCNEKTGKVYIGSTTTARQ